MPGGRPSSYKPEYAEQAKALCDKGFTDNELAAFFKIDRATIYRWKSKYPEFCDAIKIGGEAADERVERSLFERATGYRHKATKIMQHQGQVIQQEYLEVHPPETAAMIFWLKNRRRDKWRDKTEQELTGKDGEALVPVLNVALGRDQS